MRSGIAIGTFVCASILAANAHAGQSHYLLARALNQFTASKSVAQPDLTPFVEASHEEGVAGVNPVVVNNHAEVNTDNGFMLVRSSATQPPGGGGTLDPMNWDLAARMEEGISAGSQKPTGARVTFDISLTGKITNATAASMKMSAVLNVNGCQILFTRTTTSTGAPATDNTINNCTTPGYTATGGAGALAIDVANFGSGLALEAQLDIEFSIAGAFAGQIDSALLTGTVRVQGIGGTVVGKSPTFGTKTAGGDAGVPGTDGGSSGSSGSSGTSGAPADAGTSSGAPADPGASDDGGGCNAGAASPVTSTFAGVGFAIAAAALARRARRRSSSHDRARLDDGPE